MSSIIDEASKGTASVVAAPVSVVDKPTANKIKNFEKQNPVFWLIAFVIVAYLIYKNWLAIKTWLETEYAAVVAWLTSLSGTSSALAAGPADQVAQTVQSKVYTTSGSAQVPTDSPNVPNPTAPISSGDTTPRPVQAVAQGSTPNHTVIVHGRRSPYDNGHSLRQPDPSAMSNA